jgi:hypothetical protein
MIKLLAQTLAYTILTSITIFGVVFPIIEVIRIFT